MQKLNITEPIPPGAPAEKAISRLWEEHRGRIYNLGLRLCRNPECAQDLLQETFLRAFRNWHQFEGRSSPATWLFTIAMRTCKRVRRRHQGFPTEPLAGLLRTWAEEIPDVSCEEDGPLAEVLRQETHERIYHAMGSLRIDFRVTLILKYLADFSVAEVAQVLGIKEATVKTRIHRGRLLLREELVKPPLPGQAALLAPSQQLCLDLLYANQKALARGVKFPLCRSALGSRCEILFSALDLAYDACSKLQNGELPEHLRQLLLREIGAITPLCQ